MSIFIKNVDKVQAEVYGYPKKFTKEVRQVMNTTGFETVKREVQTRLPVSKGNKNRKASKSNTKTKSHAKAANPIRRAALKGSRDYKKVGFYLTFYKSYWYLKFPNEGTGQSRSNRPIKFLEKGALAARKPIQQQVNRAIKNSHIR